MNVRSPPGPSQLLSSNELVQRKQEAKQHWQDVSTEIAKLNREMDKLGLSSLPFTDLGGAEAVALHEQMDELEALDAKCKVDLEAAESSFKRVLDFVSDMNNDSFGSQSSADPDTSLQEIIERLPSGFEPVICRLSDFFRARQQYDEPQTQRLTEELHLAKGKGSTAERLLEVERSARRKLEEKMDQLVEEGIETATAKLKATISKLNKRCVDMEGEKEAMEEKYDSLLNKCYDLPSSSQAGSNSSQDDYKQKWEEERDFRRELQQENSRVQQELERLHDDSKLAQLEGELEKSKGYQKTMAGWLASQSQTNRKLRTELRDLQQALSSAEKVGHEASLRLRHVEEERKYLANLLDTTRAEHEEERKSTMQAALKVQNEAAAKVAAMRDEVEECKRDAENARIDQLAATTDLRCVQLQLQDYKEQDTSKGKEVLQQLHDVSIQLEQCQRDKTVALDRADARENEVQHLRAAAQQESIRAQSRESDWRCLHGRVLNIMMPGDDDWEEVRRLILDDDNMLPQSPEPHKPMPWEIWPRTGGHVPSFPTIEAVCIAIRSEKSMSGNVCFLLNQLNRMLFEASSANMALIESSLCKVWTHFSKCDNMLLVDAVLLGTAQVMEAAKRFGPVVKLERTVLDLFKRPHQLKHLHDMLKVDRLVEFCRAKGLFWDSEVSYGLLCHDYSMIFVEVACRRLHILDWDACHLDSKVTGLKVDLFLECNFADGKNLTVETSVDMYCRVAEMYNLKI